MKKLKVMNSWETVDYILKNKCSIARFGDGEMDIMLGFGIGFQKSTKRLRKKLKSVKTTDKCLAAIPNIFDKKFFNRQNFKEKPYKFWRNVKFFTKPFYVHYFGGNKAIGDTNLSRFYLQFNDSSKVPEYVQHLKKMWDGRDLLFVEGEQTRLGMGNDFFSNAKSIRRILCPSKNAFDKFEEIKKAILDNAKQDDLVICALGPTATVLAFELSDKLQVLDLGHIDIEYEWFLMGATEKVPVKNKYVNECGKEGRNPENEVDKTYLSQIIQRIE